jgi:hypothetical protein
MNPSLLVSFLNDQDKGKIAWNSGPPDGDSWEFGSLIFGYSVVFATRWYSVRLVEKELAYPRNLPSQELRRPRKPIDVVVVIACIIVITNELAIFCTEQTVLVMNLRDDDLDS